MSLRYSGTARLCNQNGDCGPDGPELACENYRPTHPNPSVQDTKTHPFRSVVFNDPNVNRYDPNLQDQALWQAASDMIAHARMGSRIRLSVHSWWVREPMMEALRFAKDCLRCDIKFVLPPLSDCVGTQCKWFMMPKTLSVAKALQAPPFVSASRFYYNPTAMSDNVNHCKFILISGLDGKYGNASNVVLQSSGNWNSDDPRRGNDLLIIAESKPLYDAYTKWWIMMNAVCEKSGVIPTGFSPAFYRQQDSAVQAYFFFPYGKKLGAMAPDADPRVGMLFSPSLHAPGTKIRIAMSTWYDSHRFIVHRLAALKSLGADVAVAVHEYNGSNPETWPSVKSDLKFYKIPHVHTHTHCKYMLVDGVFNVQGNSFQRHKYVFAGSYNFQSPAMLDTLICIRDNVKIYDSYLAYWTSVCESPSSSGHFLKPC